jgi:hypothetical protein
VSIHSAQVQVARGNEIQCPSPPAEKGQEIVYTIAVEQVIGLNGFPEVPQQVYFGGVGEAGLPDLDTVISDHLDAGYDLCGDCRFQVGCGLIGGSGLDVDYDYASGACRIDFHVFSNEEGDPRAAWLSYTFVDRAKAGGNGSPDRAHLDETATASVDHVVGNAMDDAVSVGVAASFAR